MKKPVETAQKEQYTTGKIRLDIHRAISVEAAKSSKDKQELINTALLAGLKSLGISLTV